MLYLIRSWGRGGKSYLKVGYTSDLKSRMFSYYHSNPGFELLAVRQGGLTEEKKIQLYLEILGLKAEFLNEWFLDTPEVQNFFHQGIRKVNKTLWRGRDMIWGSRDKFNGILRDIYEELVMWFPGMPKGKAAQEYQKLINTEFLKSWKKNNDL